MIGSYLLPVSTFSETARDVHSWFASRPIGNTLMTDRNKAFAKELRVRKEIDLLERRETKAIAAEEHSIEEQELSELLDLDPPSVDFGLSPST